MKHGFHCLAGIRATLEVSHDLRQNDLGVLREQEGNPLPDWRPRSLAGRTCYAASSRARMSSCCPGITCPYAWYVIVVEAWPR